MNVCVFCETLYPAGIIVCNKCNEYKGLMPLEQAEMEYAFLAQEE